MGSREVESGADRDRTGDPLVANQVLSHLSYRPVGHCNITCWRARHWYPESWFASRGRSASLQIQYDPRDENRCRRNPYTPLPVLRNVESGERPPGAGPTEVR